MLRAAFRRTWDGDVFLDNAFRVRTACCGWPRAEVDVGFGAGDGGTVGLRGGRDGEGCDVGCWSWGAGLLVAFEELEGAGGVG